MKSIRTASLELETPIIPRAIAGAVLAEASVWLDTPLPRRWADELTARANTVYARNPRFRQMLRAKGNAGRDQLWAFTRHWLCALISEYRPSLLRRLPTTYQVGHPLPGKLHHVARGEAWTPTAVGASDQVGGGSRLKRERKRRRIAASDTLSDSWAAAAHFGGG